MTPGNDPTDPGALAVILYRLDDIQRDMERLASGERVDELARRLAVLEDQGEGERKWRRSLGLGVAVALVAPSVTTLLAAAFPTT